MLSICIPAYHCNVDALVLALQGQLELLPNSVEVLVCDDCSPSPVITTMPLFSGFRLLRNDHNLGRSATRNRLVHEAKGDLILFLDGDSELVERDFVAKWLKLAENDSICVCYGGSVYQEETPPAEQFLRWKVSNTRESKNLEERSKGGSGFKTNNVLLRKSIFQNLSFNEALRGYGHEDTLFGVELGLLGFQTHHITNPVKNAVLDSNEVFLRKTEEAIRNLNRCIQYASNPDAFIAQVRVLRVHRALKRFKQLWLLRMVFYVAMPTVVNRLNAGKAVGIILLFDVYKLCMLDRINRLTD
jgi:glycosyltransferase involved in cell wall biosynthesis